MELQVSPRLSSLRAPLAVNCPPHSLPAAIDTSLYCTFSLSLIHFSRSLSSFCPRLLYVPEHLTFNLTAPSIPSSFFEAWSFSSRSRASNISPCIFIYSFTFFDSSLFIFQRFCHISEIDALTYSNRIWY